MTARPIRTPKAVTIVGDGGWGTALALVVAERGLDVRLWSREPDYAREMQRTRRNPRYLPDIRLPRPLRITGDATEAFANTGLVVSAVPTQHVRATWTALAPVLPDRVPVCSVSKGLELKTLERPTQVLRDTLGRTHPLGVLAGPSHAEEVARGMPTTCVAASRNASLARAVQRAFSTDRFRVYTRTDVVGVEVAGAAKNVIALAAGILDGLGLGDNSKAALITRGAVEMARLGRALGGTNATFHGLAGIGDLIVTCTSRHGRNRAVGERIGKGETLDAILASMQMVAEGVPTTRAIVQLARKRKVDMPIAREVHHVLFEGKKPLAAVTDLMGRALKDE